MGGEAALLTQNFQIIADILETISVLMGVAFTLGGLFQLKKYGESRTMMSTQHSVVGPLLMLIAGAMLMILPTFIGAALLAFWGDSSPLSPAGGSSAMSTLMPPILMFVRIVGVGSFIRGIVLLSRSGGQQAQQGTLGKALIHIFAGVLCVHVVGTMDLLSQIMGMS
jgi:intracellular multiplication protein IcmC